MLRRISQVVYVEDVVVLPPSATVHAAATAMAQHQQCAVLVMTDGHLDGILTEQDVVRRVVAERRDPAALAVSEVMTPQPDTVEATAVAQVGLQMMDDGHYQHLPVVQDGKVVGVISRVDFLGEENTRLESECHIKERLW
jgi:signal-transduction protein with cAMP-binding, CBS, and nucleotidyltransferase domain